MGLGRQVVVARLAPIADDGPHDQALDDEEDRDRDDEDDRVEVPDLGALLGDRDRRVQAGDEHAADLEHVDPERQEDKLTR